MIDHEIIEGQDPPGEVACSCPYCGAITFLWFKGIPPATMPTWVCSNCQDLYQKEMDENFPDWRDTL